MVCYGNMIIIINNMNKFVIEQQKMTKTDFLAMKKYQYISSLINVIINNLIMHNFYILVLNKKYKKVGKESLEVFENGHFKNVQF